MINELDKRELEFLIETLPLWIRAKLFCILDDNMMSGNWDELDYLFYCLDASLEKQKIDKKIVRRIIR